MLWWVFCRICLIWFACIRILKYNLITVTVTYSEQRGMIFYNYLLCAGICSCIKCNFKYWYPTKLQKTTEGLSIYISSLSYKQKPDLGIWLKIAFLIQHSSGPVSLFPHRLIFLVPLWLSSFSSTQSVFYGAYLIWRYK